MVATKKNTQEIILGILAKNIKPMTAYQILGKMKRHGVNGPPTVYRALEALQAAGSIHRIESINAFVVCNQQEEEAHLSSFTLCKNCGDVEEIHDDILGKISKQISKKIGFAVHQQTIELIGLCLACNNQATQLQL